jgi:transposase
MFPACRDEQRLEPQDKAYPRLVRQTAALAYHFTPTSSSWINQVERFFSLLAEKIKRGAHTSVKQLIAAIEAFISRRNENPKPLRCTKSADDILTSIERFCRRTLEVNHSAG